MGTVTLPSERNNFFQLLKSQHFVLSLEAMMPNIFIMIPRPPLAACLGVNAHKHILCGIMEV